MLRQVSRSLCCAVLCLSQTWAVLYGVMGYASYLVGKSAGWGSRPMVLYGAQLALNLAWQPLFFLAKKPGVAQIDNAGELQWYSAVQCKSHYHRWGVAAMHLQCIQDLLWFGAAT